MKATVSNGLTIDRFIPPQLRNTFYKNTNRRYMRNNGLDPYGFSTDGLVLYLPLWALKGSGFQSIDAYKHIATVTGALWTPNGRLLDGNDDYILLASETVMDFTSGDFSILVRLKVSSLASDVSLFARGLGNTDGYEFKITSTKRIDFYTNQAGASQRTYGTGTVETDTWYTLGVSRVGTGALLYQDGVDVTAVGGTHINPLTSARRVIIGVSDNLVNDFPGIIQSVLVYSRSLSVAEHLGVHNRLNWRI